jgi:hypothetical protein
MVDVKIDNAKQYTTIAARFAGHNDAPVQSVYIAQWRGSRASLEATRRQNRGSIFFVSSRQTTGLHARKKKEKSTILAGHFDGHGGAPVQYRAHCLIEGVQGYDGSHWLMPRGKYCG